MDATAAARAGDLELAIGVEGTILRVRLINRGAGPLAVYFAVRSASGTHHDHLMAELTGADTRVLRFTGDRDDSPLGIVELAPGEEVADTLDLMLWAYEEINGGAPLARGTYALTATYRVDRPRAWSGTVSAGPVPLVVA